jgi:flavin reductase (DIM6/NTAB) family NADH-FMN oxidoreductase RutF
MEISAEQFRDALRQFAAGVTVVTIRSGETVHGLTVSAFASVSPDPPLVAMVIDHQHAAHALLEQPGATFAVNVLGEEQKGLSERFAWSPDAERFAFGDWKTAETGAPILVDALAWLDCTIHSRLVAGNHTIYVGRVVRSGVPRPEGRPLIYWSRDYRAVASDGA